MSLTPDFPPVRVGMIGAGRHARQVLLPALTWVPELRLVALATAREETARVAEQRYRVPTYIGYQAMLQEEELDALLVVGGSHQEEVLAGIQAGLHVWCETPCVTSSAMAETYRSVLAGTDRVFEVGSCLRHAPLYGKLKSELDRWREASPGRRLFQVRYYPYVGHFYNLLLWLNGGIAEVCAERTESETLVLLRFENGDRGTVTARSFRNTSVPYEQLAVSAEDGLLVAENGQHLHFYGTSEARTSAELEFGTSEVRSWTPTFSMPYGELQHLFLRGYIPELQHFARRIRLGGPEVCGVDAMEQTYLTQQAVHRSAASGAWERVARC